MADPLGKPSDKADRPERPVPPGCGKMRRLRRCAPKRGGATAEASAGTCNRNPASPRPAPLHSFAGATLRGPSSAS